MYACQCPFIVSLLCALKKSVAGKVLASGVTRKDGEGRQRRGGWKGKEGAGNGKRWKKGEDVGKRRGGSGGVRSKETMTIKPLLLSFNPRFGFRGQVHHAQLCAQYHRQSALESVL